MSTGHGRIGVFFLGSGAIAVPVLAALRHSDSAVQLIGCGTQPDRPTGRKRRLTPTPVGAWCEANAVAVLKPENVNDTDFIDLLAAQGTDILVVFAFGQILKRRLLQSPTYGCLNIHASLLPRHRGAAPITAAILAGDRQSGISYMQMDAGVDSGPIYQTHSIDLAATEYASELEVRLGQLAAATVTETIARIADQTLTAQPQNLKNASYAPKVLKADGRLDWTLSAAELERCVRAYHPWPGAWFVLQSARGPRRLTISAASITPGNDQEFPGTVIQADKHGWQVQCGQGALCINRLIPEGKREMTGAEFLMGCELKSGTCLTHETDDR